MLEQFHDSTPFQMVVMTLLSSRTKDSTTIPIVKKIFAQYRTPQDFLKIPLQILEKELYGIGFYRVKANNIKKLSKVIIKKYNGIIPANFGELIALPGVGPKTANCILNYKFNIPAIAVDTHVHRISNRLGWIKTKTPAQSEEALKKTVPQRFWSKVNMLLVNHGQKICFPINPKCTICPVQKYCEFGKK